MVTFDSAAYVKSELKQIKSAADRDLLTKSLPTVPAGGTSICSGLQAAFTVRRVRYGSLLLFGIFCFCENFVSGVSIQGWCQIGVYDQG